MLFHFHQHRASWLPSRQCAFQEHRVVPQDPGGHYGRFPRRPSDLAIRTAFPPLHRGRPWLPIIELVHHTFQDGANGNTPFTRGDLVQPEAFLHENERGESFRDFKGQVQGNWNQIVIETRLLAYNSSFLSYATQHSTRK